MHPLKMVLSNSMLKMTIDLYTLIWGGHLMNAILKIFSSKNIFKMTVGLYTLILGNVV